MKKKIMSDETRKGMIQMLIIAAAIIVVLIIFNVILDGLLLRPKNLMTVWAGCVANTIAAVGFVILFSGNITDLSPGGVIILAGTVTGIVGNAAGIVPMVICGVLIGVGCMALNFTVYRFSKVPPWITGLGMLMVYESITMKYSEIQAAHGQSTVVINDDVRVLGQKPAIYICWGVAIVIAYIYFNHTSLGIKYRAAGENEAVTKIMGINVNKALILGGVVAGAFFGFAGVIKECYNTFIIPQSGMTSLSTIFQPMAAALLALALASMINVVLAIPIAAFIIGLIFNILTMFGVPSGTLTDFCLGVVVIAFAALAQRGVKGVVK
ncbi:MAG: hypothetical protein LIO96_02635 [Lachnospiraceae bacterium]|nr:hypothetical protein [Lachnospiraceae bacterium]